MRSVALIIFAALAMEEVKPTGDTIHEVANTYFRIGQQCALTACNHNPNHLAMVVDDPEIWYWAQRYYPEHFPMGLDTNRWTVQLAGKNEWSSHTYTLLKH